MLNKLLDTFFHLPTLMTLAIITLVIFWQIYGIGLNWGNKFIRLNSNRGSITLHWMNGCCELDW
jgi:hypothetical protein